MPVTIYAEDNEFAAASGSNVDVHSDYSYFDHPPNSTSDLTITSNMGDDYPFVFDVGETYDITWSGHGGGNIEDATIIRSDYVGPGQGAVVFEGTNSNTGETFQMVWSPGFDLEDWYWSSGGGPSSPNAFWTSDQNTSETYQAVCYAAGTLIDTPSGSRAVEELEPNDLIETLDNGAVPVRWIRHETQPLEAFDKCAKPVLIEADALGPGHPSHKLVVSPQHRILVGGSGQLDSIFKTQVFVPAKSLTSLPRIRHMMGKKDIVWVHFACDRHEVVFANGCLSESLLLGPMVVQLLNKSQRKELFELFGPAPKPGEPLNGPSARKYMTLGSAQRKLKAYRKDNRASRYEGSDGWGANNLAAQTA